MGVFLRTRLGTPMKKRPETNPSAVMSAMAMRTTESKRPASDSNPEKRNVPRRNATMRFNPVASTAMMAVPTESPKQVASAMALFFHHGREAPALTSSKSKSAWMPPEASQKNTAVAGAATEPSFQAAT